MVSSRKRVLFLVPSLICGGAQRVFSTLLRHLDRNQFEIHVALLESKGAFLGDIPGDVTVHDLKVSRTRYALPGIVRIVTRVEPEVVFSTLIYLNLSLLLSRPFLPRRTRVVVRESTMPSTFLQQETKYPRVWAWMYRRLYRRADAVICPSDSMVTEMADQFQIPNEKLVRIYNPTDTENIRRLAQLGDRPFSGPGPHLVFAGRLSREKGLDLLLNCLPAVRKIFPEVRLTVLGDGPLEGHLQDQAKRLNLSQVAEFLGFQQNPWRFIQHADLFVLPSRYEGVPNVVLEALALGTPVLATDCPGGMREIHRYDDRVTLVTPENPEALASGIVEFCKDLQRRQSAAPSSREVPVEFALQKVVGEYSKVFSPSPA